MIKNSALRNIGVILSFLLVLLFVGCTSSNSKLLSSSESEKTVVMTIDGMDVPMEIYRYVALNHKTDMEKGASVDIWLGEDGQSLLDTLDQNVSETLKMLYATPTLCQKYGIDPESSYITDAVNARMNDIYASYENNLSAYVDDLHTYHMNDNVYRFVVRNDVLASELLYAMISNREIPDDDEELRTIIDSDSFIRVKQILIPFDNGRSREENFSLACELLQKIHDGSDFDSLVQQYGGDVNLFNNLDGYYITKGSYQHAFEEAAFSLDVGDVSDIIETSVGYSIIKRYEKDTSYLTSHFDELANDYVSSQYNLAVEAHRDSLSIEKTDAFSSFTIFNLETSR